jgi:DNA-directed RNA polymerase specialized sigma24 family protein
MGMDARDRLEEALETMLRDRFPEGLVRLLQNDFPGVAYADREDAVAIGFEKLVAADRVMDSPRGYVTAVAVNAMKRILRKRALEALSVDGDEDETGDPWADPTFDEASTANAYAFMRDLVGAWESKNLKTATMLVIDAGRLGEPINGVELAQRLEEILGEQVLPVTARKWRERGLRRLRAELVEVGLMEDKEEG